ncbi:MAG: hypothetical protein JXR40_06860 [Pontiellaceae bacterium]|nr:hypothetical protein [Pontiellaceae bacterium]
MELRIQLRHMRLLSRGTLTCRKCGAKHQTHLFQGGVCRACWTGYDLSSETPLCIESSRTEARALIKQGVINREDLAKAVGYSFSSLSKFLRGSNDSVFVAEAIGRYLEKEVRHAG